MPSWPKLTTAEFSEWPGFLFLRIEVADGVALFDAPLGRNRAGREQQRLGQGGLAGPAMTDQRDGTHRLGGVSGHLVLPELV